MQEICFRRWSRKNYAAFNSLGKVIKIGVMCAVCSLLSLPASAARPSIFSQDSLYAEEEPPEIELSEVVISGNAAASAPVIASISRAQIAGAGVQNLQDLLRYLQSTDIRFRGTENIQADASVRGGTFDQCMVLLNGINMSDPQTGHHSLNLPISLADIERVDILQGAAAWTEGVGPLVGALNFITVEPKQSHVQLTAAGGMYGYGQGGAQIIFSKKRFSILASGEYSRSDGYTKNTDFEIGQAYLQMSYAFKKASQKIGFQGGYQQKAFGANGFYSQKYPEQFERLHLFTGSLSYQGSLKNWQWEAAAYARQNQDHFALFRNEAPAWYTGANEHLSLILGGKAAAAYRSKGGLTKAGISTEMNRLYSTNVGLTMEEPKSIPFTKDAYFVKEARRIHYAVYALHLWEYKNWSVEGALRLTGMGELSPVLNASLQAEYKINNFHRLQVLIYQSDRLPTFTDLYYISATQEGNLNLKAEKALSTQLRWDGQKGGWQWQSSIFYRYGFEMIDWIKKPEGSVWKCTNLGNIGFFGFEAGASLRLKGYLKWASIQYTYLYADKKDMGGYQSLYVTDYLRHQVKFSLQHKIWKDLSMSWHFDFNDRKGDYKPYMLCDIKLSYDRKMWGIFISAQNVFNTRYMDISGIEPAGIWVKAGGNFRLNF